MITSPETAALDVPAVSVVTREGGCSTEARGLYLRWSRDAREGLHTQSNWVKNKNCVLQYGNWYLERFVGVFLGLAAALPASTWLVIHEAFRLGKCSYADDMETIGHEFRSEESEKRRKCEFFGKIASCTKHNDGEDVFRVVYSRDDDGLGLACMCVCSKGQKIVLTRGNFLP